MASNPGKAVRKPRPALARAIDRPIIEPAAPIAALPAPAEEPPMDTTDTSAMFADATARAEDGISKSRAMFADLGEFGQGNVQALVESSRIAAKGMETLGQHAAVFVRAAWEDAQAQARSLASAGSPTEMLRLQGDFARQSFDKMVAETSRGTEAMMKLVGEIAQPISNRVALAADRMKVAA